MTDEQQAEIDKCAADIEHLLRVELMARDKLTAAVDNHYRAKLKLAELLEAARSPEPDP